jgi:(p)ppGpp synthase/HD superfamily hydrolase
MNIIEKAKKYAVEQHKSVNHKYGDKDYSFHLEMVASFADKYKYLIDHDQRDNFVAAAWVHDVIEDCRQTYNDVLQATNIEVAELAYALTNEKGKTRKERANDKYYSDMRKVKGAVLLKICDRLANVIHSIQTNSKMLEKYREEHISFIFELGILKHTYADALKELGELFRAHFRNNKAK